MAATEQNGIMNRRSNHPVDETVTRIEAMLKEKGITLFALIDHSGEAEKVGLKMRPTKLLIFGSPKAGTPLMQAAPSIALDLPLKILVRQDETGQAWVSYNSADYLLQRHHLPSEMAQNIAGAAILAELAAQ